MDLNGGQRKTFLDVASLRLQLDAMRRDVEALAVRAGSFGHLEHFRQYSRVVDLVDDWLDVRAEPTGDDLLAVIYAELARSGENSGVAAALADLRRWLDRDAR